MDPATPVSYPSRDCSPRGISHGSDSTSSSLGCCSAFWIPFCDFTLLLRSCWLLGVSPALCEGDLGTDPGSPGEHHRYPVAAGILRGHQLGQFRGYGAMTPGLERVFCGAWGC